MPIFFDLPDPRTLSVLEEVMNTYHPHLVKAKVNVGIVVCRKEDKEGFSKESFPPAYARIRPTSRKNRLHCPHDATIELCHFHWESMDTQRQRALLDHELTHLLVREKEGQPILDDLGRPLLRMRKDEIELTAFTEVIERHGKSALDWASISSAYNKAQTALGSSPVSEDSSIEPLPGKVGDIVV